MSEKLPAWEAWLFSTPWWVPAILATVLTLWLMWVSWPRSAHTPRIEELPRKISGSDSVVTRPFDRYYPARVHADTRRLVEDRFIEIAIVGLNATAGAITFMSASGNAELAGNSWSCDLDVPNLRKDKMGDRTMPGAEFMIIFEQRIPAKVIDRMIAEMASESGVKMILTKLNIKTVSTIDNEEFRFPLMDKLILSTASKYPTVGFSVNMSVKMHGKGTMGLL